MKNVICTTGLVALGLVLFAGCTTMHTWPNYERSAENKMLVIQENIGDGLKTGALTPDQSQMFLTTLKGIRTDYAELRDKRISQEQWNSLHERLDVLGAEVNRATRTAGIEEPRSGDRIVALQRTIDDGRINRRWPATEGRDFQARLDSTRSDYLRLTEGGRSATYEERAGISRRLDSLETDLNGFREGAARMVPAGRACMYNGATVATQSTICRSGITFLCEDGEWRNLGSACQ